MEFHLIEDSEICCTDRKVAYSNLGLFNFDYLILTATIIFLIPCMETALFEGGIDSTGKTVCRLRYRHTALCLLCVQTQVPGLRVVYKASWYS